MATIDLKEFVEERLLAFDPDIDLTDGSPAQDQVVDPIVRRFQPDPFEMDVDKFIEARLIQEYPDYNVREGSGLRDLLVKPNQILLDPIEREFQLVKQGQSLANPELLAPSEADALVANVFVTRNTGELASGRVRLFFNAPIAVNISIGNVCYTADGRRFLPTTLQSISAEAMLFNQSGSLFYFDIDVTAEEAGDEYNVDAGDIIGITNLNTAVRVSNLESFNNGIVQETTEELVERAETSITERSLVVARGATARLTDQFGDLKHFQVVGFLDEEMNRDIIVGGDLGPVLYSGADGYTEDDGDGDIWTQSFKTRDQDWTSIFGGLGTVSNYYLTVGEMEYGTDGEVPSGDLSHFIVPSFTGSRSFSSDDVGSALVTFNASNPENVGVSVILARVSDNTVKLDRTGVIETGVSWALLRASRDYEIDSVVATDELKINDQLPINRRVLSWAVRQKLLTISDIPGGIIFSADAEAIEIQSNEIHIGGATDFYVRGTSVSQEELVVEAVSDEFPIVNEVTGSTDSTYTEFFRDDTKDFGVLGIVTGQSLVIETGPDAGTKQIIAVGIKPSTAPGTAEQYLQVNPPITATAVDLRYRIIDDIDVNLNQPRTVRGRGEDLETIQLSSLVTTTSAVDFLGLGTEIGDTLEIVTGEDKGEYQITDISGTGNKNLEIAAAMKATATNLSWEVYKAGDGINFPLVRIRNIELLDSSNQPTGFTIPFADPIDARSTAFSNAGRGTKVSTSDAITGIVGSLDLDGLTYPLAATTIDVVVNGTSNPVVLTGAANKTDLLNKINAVVPDVAGTLNVDGEDRLTIRSGDRWVQIAASGDNTNVGLDAAGEDNRQIKSAGNITDWTSAAYDLKAEQDVVFIQTGDNVGQLFLVSISSGKLLAINFDEDSGRIRFLNPNVGIKMSAGSRSFGKARVYFLEPTSFQVRGSWRPALKNTTDFPANQAITAAGTTIDQDEQPRSYFTATINGSSLRFFPDPALNHQIIPAPDEDVPNNLATAVGDNTVETQASEEPVGDLGKNSRDAERDFLLEEVLPGDLLEITYQPVQGTSDVTDGVLITYPPAIQNRTLIIAVDGGPFKTHTFTDQVNSPDDMADEINDFVGEDIAFIEDVSGAKYLRFEADFEFTIRKDSTLNIPVGLPTGANSTNKADANIDGFYVVTYTGDNTDPDNHDKLEIEALIGGAAPAVTSQAQHYRILRRGVQRLHSTLMNENVELGMYYMDVELVSEGSGDQWNLDADEVFTVEGYESDGYRLVVRDPDLSYSEEEQLDINFTRRIIPVGSSDKPSAATQIHSQNIQINYDRSPLTASIQAFASSELERVLNASILVRHLQPHYLNFELTYRSGSSADVVTDDVNSYLDNLGPTERVESSDIQNLALRRGAGFVNNPITLVAITHDEERKISVERSQNFVTKGRLATFFSGDITVTRETIQAL